MQMHWKLVKIMSLLDFLPLPEYQQTYCENLHYCLVVGSSVVGISDSKCFKVAMVLSSSDHDEIMLIESTFE